MKNFTLLFCVALLGCATPRSAPSSFDLGSLPPLPATTSLQWPIKSLKVADISAPSLLDGPLMLYRLSYAEAQQPRPYANSRWSMPPAQMLTQRIKASLAQEGVQIVQASDSVNHGGLLRIELDEFIQHFSQAQQSYGHLRWRASLIQGRQLVAQKTFQQAVPATSHNAAGGAQALAKATDLALVDLKLWLASLPAAK